MKIFKRVLAAVLAMVLFITALSGCSSLNLKNNDAVITRAEWISLLAAHFGLQNDKDSEPYFQDVSIENEIYDDVQSCVDWGIIPSSNNFFPDSKVTREYAFATAVKAIGSETLHFNGDETDKQLAKVANKLGMAKSTSWLYMHEGLTQEEANELGKQAAIEFCGHKIVDHDNTKYLDTVKFQENTDNCIIDTINNKVTVSNGVQSNSEAEYSVGDIVVFGSGKDIKQYKITGVSTVDGRTVYNTEIPAIEEVYDEIDVGGTGVLEDISDIHCEDGVTLTEVDGVLLTDVFKKAAVSSLGLANDDVNNQQTGSDKGANFKIEIEFSSDSKPELSASADLGNGWEFEGSGGGEDKKANKDLYDITKNGEEIVDKSGEKISPDLIRKYEKEKITKNKNGKTTVSTGYEYKRGWKITGAVEVTNMQPSVDVQTNKFLGAVTGFKSYDIECNPTFEGSVEIEGYASFERKIAAVEYAVGPLVVEVALNMKVELNGKVTFGVSVKQNTHISYSEDNGYKKVCSSNIEPSIEFEASLKITPVEISLSLKIGWFTLIDASISAAVKFSLKLSGTWFVFSREGIFAKGGDEIKLEDAKTGFLFCREYQFVGPLVELKLGTEASLLGKIGVSFTWKIMDEEDAPLKPLFNLKSHCEGEALNAVDQCTADSLKPYEYKDVDEAKQDENYDESTTTGNEYNTLIVDTYAVDVEKGKEATITVEEMPKGYSIGDVKVVSSDNNVAQVSSISPNGSIKVKGVSEGTATMSISVKNTDISIEVLVIVI